MKLSRCCAALVGIAVACRSPASPLGGAHADALAFEPLGEPVATPSVTIEGVDRAIRIDGDYHVPCAFGPWPSVSTEQHADSLFVTLAVNSRIVCIEGSRPIKYVLFVRDVPPGWYWVRVIHGNDLYRTESLAVVASGRVHVAGGN